jgi:GR25 family glycosyltransferase involved in LPS biosynthesis
VPWNSQGIDERRIGSEIFLAGLPKPSSHVYDAMSLSEIGCTYAHLKVLTMAAKSNHLTLILEDDAEFEPDVLKKVLNNLGDMPKDAIVKLEGNDKPGRRIVLGPRSIESRFMVSIRPSRGSAGYLVTPASASRLLESARDYPMPYDTLLNDSGWHGCFLLDAVPYPIRQAGQMSSTITRGIKRHGVKNRIVRQRDKFLCRLRRVLTQLRWARKANFTRVHFAKFYE